MESKPHNPMRVSMADVREWAERVVVTKSGEGFEVSPDDVFDVDADSAYAEVSYNGQNVIDIRRINPKEYKNTVTPAEGVKSAEAKIYAVG